MAIIINLKDAIRDAFYKQDKTLKFNFNEIPVVEYPFIFFYIPSFKLDKAIDSEYWRKLTLMCVVEYAKSEENNSAELWEYSDTMAKTLKLFDFLNTKLSVENPEFRIVDNVLQMTFDLEFYVREEDTTELMRELDFTFKERNYGSNTAKI